MRKPTLEQARWALAWTECWELLCRVFPSAKAGDGLSDVYADRLGDIAPDLLRAAVEQVLSTRTFANLPSIGEIRLAAREIVSCAQPSALEVYGDTIAECSLAIRDQRAPRLDPAIAAIVSALGGARSLTTSKDTATDRAHFLKALEHQRRETNRLSLVSPEARKLIALPAPREIPGSRSTTAHSRGEFQDGIALVRREYGLRRDVSDSEDPA